MGQVAPDTRYSQYDLSTSYCGTSKLNTRFRFRFRFRYPTHMARISAPKIPCQSRFGRQRQPLARHRLVAYSPRVNYDMVAELCPSDSDCGYNHAQSERYSLYVPPADIYPTRMRLTTHRPLEKPSVVSRTGTGIQSRTSCVRAASSSVGFACIP
jgi:hypothetical protein